MMKFKNGDGIWFTADIHYGHKNLVRGVSEWSDKNGCRDFDTVDEMNDTIINGINSCAQQDDTLFVLGDWSFAGIDNVWKLRDRIICRHIFFILGNHDHHIANNRLLEASPEFYFAQELFTEVDNYMEITIGKQQIVMSHYPMAAWNNSFKGSWMLHGHTHDTIVRIPYVQWYGSDYYYTSAKILDVGLDTARRLLGEYRPFSYYEIEQAFVDKAVVTVDHHTRDTKSPNFK